MRKGLGYILFFFLWMVLGSHCLMAQLVPTYTQYVVNQAIINPAYAGANNCLNLTGMYRQQWSNYDGAPSTKTLSAHTPLKNRALAVGLNVMNDVYGVSSNTLLEGLLAYRLRMGKYHKLSFGIGAGIYINKNNLANIKVNDAGDEVYATNLNSTTPNFSFGVYFENKKYFLGLSALNLNRNLVNSPTFVYQQPFYFIAGYHFKLNHMFMLTPYMLLKKVNSSPLQADLNLLLTYNRQFKIGAGYRTNDAFYGVLLFQLNDQLQIGYSYDYTLSSIRQFQNGTHEISVRYLFQYKTQTVDVKTFQ